MKNNHPEKNIETEPSQFQKLCSNLSLELWGIINSLLEERDQLREKLEMRDKIIHGLLVKGQFNTPEKNLIEEIKQLYNEIHNLDEKFQKKSSLQL